MEIWGSAIARAFLAFALQEALMLGAAFGARAAVGLTVDDRERGALRAAALSLWAGAQAVLLGAALWWDGWAALAGGLLALAHLAVAMGGFGRLSKFGGAQIGHLTRCGRGGLLWMGLGVLPGALLCAFSDARGLWTLLPCALAGLLLDPSNRRDAREGERTEAAVWLIFVLIAGASAGFSAARWLPRWSAALAVLACAALLWLTLCREGRRRAHPGMALVAAAGILSLFAPEKPYLLAPVFAGLLLSLVMARDSLYALYLPLRAHRLRARSRNRQG